MFLDIGEDSCFAQRNFKNALRTWCGINNKGLKLNHIMVFRKSDEFFKLLNYGEFYLANGLFGFFHNGSCFC